MTTQSTPVRNLVAAAKALLEAREDQMITRVEWDALASAVTAVDAADVEDATTYDGFLEVWNEECLAAAKAALDGEGVEYAAPAGADGSVFDVPAITAGQYNRVIEALSAAGEPGEDWNFTLD